MESGAKKQEAEYFEALQKHSIGLKKMKTEVIFVYYSQQGFSSFDDVTRMFQKFWNVIQGEDL